MGILKKVYKIQCIKKITVLNAERTAGNDYEGEETTISYLNDDNGNVFNTSDDAEIGLLELLEWYNEEHMEEANYEYTIIPIYTFIK